MEGGVGGPEPANPQCALQTRRAYFVSSAFLWTFTFFFVEAHNTAQLRHLMATLFHLGFCSFDFLEGLQHHYLGLTWSSKQSTPTVTTTPGVEGACCSCQCKANRCHKIAPPPPPRPPEICHERSHFAFPPDHQTIAITGLRPSVKRAQICSSLPTACCSVSI